MLYVLHMHSDLTRQKEVQHQELDLRQTSLLLHSKLTVLKRVLHILSIAAVLYSFGMIAYHTGQIKGLNKSQNSVIGLSSTRSEIAKQYAGLLAQQWAAEEFQDPIEKDALLKQWGSLKNIHFVAAYSNEGFLIRRYPDGIDLKSILVENPTFITATSEFAGSESIGSIVLVFDDSEFTMLAGKKSGHWAQLMVFTLLLGGITGGYAFRGFRYFRPKHLDQSV